MKEQEIVELYKKRIDDLVNKLTSGHELNITTAESCFMGTLRIIESLYGANSPQFKAFLETKKEYLKPSYEKVYGIVSLSKSIKGTLFNIKEELNEGLIRNITKETAGEVIGDLTSLAKAEIKEGYIEVAAVLASAALEDALKRKAEEIGLNVESKTLNEVINALKSKSFFKGAQTKIVPSFVKLRDYAMHAEWDKIQKSDVSSLIGFLEPFLLEHFS